MSTNPTTPTDLPDSTAQTDGPAVPAVPDFQIPLPPTTAHICWKFDGKKVYQVEKGFVEFCVEWPGEQALYLTSPPITPPKNGSYSREEILGYFEMTMRQIHQEMKIKVNFLTWMDTMVDCMYDK